MTRGVRGAEGWAMETQTEVRPAEVGVVRRLPSRKATVVSVAILVALGTGLRLYRLGSQPIWLDEATSLHFAHQSLRSLWNWRAVADPGNPPLYYSLLHWWLRFGRERFPGRQVPDGRSVLDRGSCPG